MMRQYEFIELNKSKGYHWFDRSTIRCFSSKVLDWDIISGHFISSERGPNGIRAYTLRKADFTSGEVRTIGEFQAYGTIGRARTAFKNALKGKL